ncbi:cytosolic phospholipase A2 zeta-like isoform X1 [Hypomesus transpacificus]|uniref:cytosolic phospholipase A2 zeta-like isoform X1 n=1 Tax=Hypomesus transpacificus TaxID=137520 RepID=UPI001F0767D8|nr:cytosolic phospholipase A2 zeta-like isoform X1 [Hypomesus transpacificus]
MQNKESPAESYSNLKVTVLRAKTSYSRDYWSESDCYVTLHLPTASSNIHRTKTVDNSSTPEWNETFDFRVQTCVKNILEIRLYDEDTFTDGDDLCSVVLFDINNLVHGVKETKVFNRDSQTNDELWMEFQLLECGDPPCKYISNGVLMAAPFTAVDVSLINNKLNPEIILRLTGAYNEDQKIASSEQITELVKTLRFYVNRHLETELMIDQLNSSSGSSANAVQLKELPAKDQVKVSIPFGEEKLDLHLKMEDRPETDFQVRLDFNLSPQEEKFLEQRRVVVDQALKKVLKHNSSCTLKKVPVIAVVASGGGTRAMTGMYGSLRGLQRIGLLDTVTYITGVSGSTWAMAKLNEQDDWSHCDMEKAIAELEKEITKSALSAFTLEKLQYYNTETGKREQEGHPVSLIDMWGLVIEQLTHGKKNSHTLSEQQRAVSKGQNPLPIYTAVNMKEGRKGTTAEKEWCEFTPYEVGIPKYGAFVRTEDFGSEFYLGHMIKKLPETRLPYLIGLWSSVFSLNLTQLWTAFTGMPPSWSPWLGENVSNIEADSEPITLDTYLLTPVTSTASMISSFFKSRPVITEIYNFMRGFFMHYNYNKNSNFKAWKDSHPDAFPNNLTPADSKLHLVDAGHAINIGCPPVLRPQRGVDVILSLSYSWDPQDVLQVIKLTQDYCEDHKIPFPHIDFSKLQAEPVRELYVFEDKENPKAPILLHMPLVNVSYREFKAPGQPRKGEEEMEAGKVDVSSDSSPYKTSNLTYSVKDYRSLVDLTTYNVVNNKDAILKALCSSLDRAVPVKEENSQDQDKSVKYSVQ